MALSSITSTQDIIREIEEAIHNASEWIDEVLTATEERETPLTEVEIYRLEVDADRLCQLGATLQNFGECASLALQKAQAKHDTATRENQATVFKTVIDGFETLIAECGRTREEIEKARVVAETNRNLEEIEARAVVETLEKIKRPRACLQDGRYCINGDHSTACIEWRKALDEAEAERLREIAIRRADQNDASKISDGADGKEVFGD